jgi:hypothetical protein
MKHEVCMAANRPRKAARRLIVVFGGLLGLCALVASVSALSNVGLPAQSSVVDRLVPADKALLAEATNLRASLGDAVWPGWSEPRIPFVVYNESYAFLVGYPAAAGQPPDGWLKMPQREQRGGRWERVPGDTFEGQPYYRQPLAGAGGTPEAFTVLVGEHWAASFQTREYAQISLIAGMRAELPPVVRSIVPYRVVWALLMGESDAHVAALLHEAFHAYQGGTAPDRFSQAEQVMALERSYPFDAAPDEWQRELDLLAGAAQAGSDAEARELARSFLAQRDGRRASTALSAEQIDFERQREWLEGLAKYAELAGGRAAALSQSYQPVPALAQVDDFHEYASRDDFWRQQLDEVRRMQGHQGEVRFYYTGFAQAALLDRLAPGWMAQAFEPGVWLEELLRAALSQP